MGTKVLADVVVEIVRSVGSEFDRVVVVNAHGGNAYALRAAADTCAADGRPFSVWSVRLPGADAHAGRTETSLLLHLAPELAQLDRAVSRREGRARRAPPGDDASRCAGGLTQRRARRSSGCVGRGGCTPARPTRGRRRRPPRVRIGRRSGDRRNGALRLRRCRRGPTRRPRHRSSTAAGRGRGRSPRGRRMVGRGHRRLRGCRRGSRIRWARSPSPEAVAAAGAITWPRSWPTCASSRRSRRR
ncbi:MAG: creatininase family protein [Acidimicrobiales bacterium]